MSAMKFFVLVIACFLTYNSLAQSKDLKERVNKLHRNFIESILAEDHQRVSEILADDVTLGTPGEDLEQRRITSKC